MSRGSSPPRAAQDARAREAMSLFRAGRVPEALRAAEALTRSAPGFPPGWFVASYLRLRLGDPEAALAAIRKANRLAPGTADWQLQELLCLEACGRREPAIRLGRELAAAGRGNPGWHAAVSRVLFGLQQYDGARRAQLAALAGDPEAAWLHLGLANIELALGDIEAARAACERCLALEPGHAEALYFRSGLGRQTAADNHVAELERALSPPPASPVAHAKVLYALGKELEDLGEHERSFSALERGARLYRGTLRFDVAEELRFLDAIRATWNRDVPEPALPAGDSGRVPIFVVGLPRTGTTLVERILGAHSEVHSAGELPDFSRHISRMMDRLPGASGLDRPAMVARSTGLDFAALGRAYLEQATPLAGPGRYFVDKFPQNALFLGPIRRALPAARLVLVWRHPMDTCYSMYRQMFTDIYQFSYDLDELARYYVAYRRLMRHWVDVLGEGLHVVHYEDLVADQEAVSRRLVEACGLAWEPGCLEFHKSAAPTITASASQVRREIYSTSVGRWRSVRERLRPLEERLAAAGCLDDWRLDRASAG